jgi:hypothetical protein
VLKKILLLSVGIILIYAITLGIASLMVWLIPIRGTALACIALPICLPMCGFGGLFYIAWVCGGNRERQEKHI